MELIETSINSIHSTRSYTICWFRAGELWLHDNEKLAGTVPVKFLPSQSLQKLGFYYTKLEGDIGEIIRSLPNLGKLLRLFLPASSI